jgi:hypothetical protein
MVRALFIKTVLPCIAGVLLASFLGVLLNSPDADGATARQGNYRLLYLGWGDRAYNYDNLTESATYTNVDWPVNILWWGNANVFTVKSQIGFGSTCGSKMKLRLDDGDNDPGLRWDEDGGTKSPCAPVCYQTAHHMRVYAPYPADKFYNPSWQYYVLATTHKDNSEFCVPGAQRFGWSESAEHWFMTNAQVPLSGKVPEWSNWFNAEPFRVEGNHVWDNSGYTTAVKVP